MRNKQVNITYRQTSMDIKITTINFGGVNCYLLQSDTNYILIDNGIPAKWAYLERELQKGGCNPGNLKLVVLTHGDLDHAGNSSILKEKYGVKIAMHYDDSLMVEKGDMNWNRKEKPDKFSILFRAMRLMSFFSSSPVNLRHLRRTYIWMRILISLSIGSMLKLFIFQGTQKVQLGF